MLSALLAAALTTALAAGASSRPRAHAAAACLQWDVTGSWQTHQSNNYTPTFSFTQSGTSVSGSATLPGNQLANAGFAGPGSVSGTLNGASLVVTVTWPLASGGSVSGTYRATIVAGGSAGQGQLSGGTAGPGVWTGSGPATCVAAPPTGPGGSPTGLAAPGGDTAGVDALRGTVLFRVNGGPWQPLTPTTKLGKGVEISTDVDAEVRLKFSDGSEMTLNEMTQVHVDDLLVRGSRQQVAVQLLMGEMAAKVNPKKAFDTTFDVATPPGTSGTRGTVFSVFYDAVAKSTIVSTSEGKVAVDPARKGLPTRIVPAGREIELTAKSISRLVKPGKAGARGGVNRRRARDLVAKRLHRFRKPCALTIPASPSAVAVKPARGGWLVLVKVAGKAKGKATFGVVRGKAKPKNAVAKKITRGCR